MSPLIVPLHLVLVTLAGSGIVKLIRPAAASKAIVDAELVPTRRPGNYLLVGRLLGLAELAVGFEALVRASPLSLLAAGGFYVAFNAFLLRLGRVAAGADCGCLGSSSRPPGPGHYVANSVAAVICVLAAAMVASGYRLEAAQIASFGPLLALCYWLLLVVVAWLISVGPPLVATVLSAPSRAVS